MHGIYSFPKRSSSDRVGRTVFAICGALLLAVMVARLVLPWAVVSFANSKLEKMECHTGHTESVGFHWASGKVTVRSVVLRRLDENEAAGTLRIRVEK